jgi:hypothetical protein
MTNPTSINQITIMTAMKGEIGSVPGIPCKAPPIWIEEFDTCHQRKRNAALAIKINAVYK